MFFDFCFGTSEAFGRALNIFDASPTAQTAALDLLFNPASGAGFTILRNRIGNSNTASDSVEPNAPSSPTATPAYDFDGIDSGQVWLSQQARAMGVQHIYADAWGAPYFMKTNDNLGNGGFLCGVTGETCSSGSWLQAYANFLVQYIKFYQSVNVTIDYLGFLNEPEFAASYSSMLSDGQQAADFIKVLHPTLASAGLSNVKIACCDSEGWANQRTMTADMVTAGVDSEIGVITSHSYTTQPDTPISIDHNVWMTEYADLSGSWDTNWFQSGIFGEGFFWAQLIYKGIVNAGAETAATTNSCLISINGDTVIASARLWAMAQWSRYVRPGAIRTATTSSLDTLLTSAFKNVDGTVSVQVLNTATSSQAVTITVSGGTFTLVTALTSNQANGGVPTALSATLSGGVISATVSASSMTTFILSGISSTSPPPSSSTSTAHTTTTASSTSSPSPTSGGTVAEFGQCGGISYSGSTACMPPFTCQVLNPYFSQCL
ncbi:hypothetical protein D9757_002993 [Collybiopsis confluens]|uniref:CBM1 domain-containing protein n=1 Tax=Collybiopsis confluens TaxID=2823264 RepID=A0A8H5HX41_9AGAR|nr:hypothetical protein D9757_002993 [Collybiopsis confluens]